MAKLSDVLEVQKFTPADLPDLEGKLFFEGDRAKRHRVQFAFLLFLSTLIAVPGLSTSCINCIPKPCSIFVSAC